MQLTRRERRLYNRIAQVFAPYLSDVSRSILREQGFDIAQLPEQLQAALITELQTFFLADADVVRRRDGLPDYNEDELANAAATWARTHTYDLVRGLTETTRTIIQSVVSSAQETPGLTLDDMTRMLEPAFGKRRSQTIAVTETTRASAAAVNGLQGHYRNYGLSYQRQWITANDDLVCPICGPLNRKYEEQWARRFPDGPPAHPNCRCYLVLKMKVVRSYTILSLVRGARLPGGSNARIY
jgi:hypothetical protein